MFMVREVVVEEEKRRRMQKETEKKRGMNERRKEEGCIYMLKYIIGPSILVLIWFRPPKKNYLIKTLKGS